MREDQNFKSFDTCGLSTQSLLSDIILKNNLGKSRKERQKLFLMLFYETF